MTVKLKEVSLILDQFLKESSFLPLHFYLDGKKQSTDPTKVLAEIWIPGKNGEGQFLPHFHHLPPKIKKGKIMKKEEHIIFERTYLADGVTFRQAVKRMLIVLPNVITEGTL